jgi:nucleoside-triphosphatase THEP1
MAITGPTGAGKSTVGEAVAKRLERSVNIDADHIKHMIVSGFYVNKVNPQDSKGWGFSEWGLVGESIGLLAKNFLSQDYNVIINGYIDEPAWDAIENQVRIDFKVLLLPQVDMTISRDAGRVEDVRMGDETVREHHKHFLYDQYFHDFITLDTTDQSKDQTVSEVISILDLANEADA